MPSTLPRLALSLHERSNLLEREFDIIILPHPHLPPLLRYLMLDHDLLACVLQEGPDVSRVPEFAGDAQVLAASHQGVGFAALGGCGDAVWVKVLLLSTRDGD